MVHYMLIDNNQKEQPEKLLVEVLISFSLISMIHFCKFVLLSSHRPESFEV